LPYELDGVNWAAFAFAPLWSLVYGPSKWRWRVWTPLLLFIAFDNVALLFFDSRTVYREVSSATGLLMTVGGPLLYGWYATVVNRDVWRERQSRFNQDPEDFSRALPLDRYCFWQRLWTIVFAILFGLGVGLTVFVLITEPIRVKDWTSWWGLLVVVTLFFYGRRASTDRRASSTALEEPASEKGNSA
jgi:drug/metabolite transporter (DMT)-like permease